MPNMTLKERQKHMEEERVPMSFVKTLLYSIATACISVYQCLLCSLAARVSFNLFNINQTMVISSDSESLVEQQGQKDKDESLDAEWEEEDGSDEIITPSEPTEGREDLDRFTPCISMVEDGGASHTEAPTTVAQLDIWSPQQIPYHVLASATNNFSEEMMLGRGGFGPVYRGFLVDLGVDVAIKKLSERSQQGLSEYMAEVKIITQVRHRNLVKLIGWCHEHGEFLLVYEFLPNGSLDRHLFGDSSNSLLDWSVRYKVAVGLANALMYLHDECEPCVLHRDVKSSNVLLDSKFDTKLADFGLARHFSIDDSSVRVSCPAGTRGYWAPEYALRCRASTRSDVYSFGVVALEIACGKKAILVIEGEDRESDVRLLVEWVWELHGKGSILDAADNRLNGGFDQLQMERLLMVGLWCAQPDPRERPSMRQAGNALLFRETTPLPDLPRMAVSWAHAVASMRMQTVQPSSMPVSSPTLPLISDDLLASLKSRDGNLNTYPKPKWGVFPQLTWWTKRSRTRSRELLGDDPEFKKLAVKLSTLTAATDNFYYGNMLEQDGSATVYKGVLPDGRRVAVKRFSHSDDGVLEWREQVVALSRLQHWNLVGLLGFCIKGKERLLVYEYISNRCLELDKLLFEYMRDAQEITSIELFDLPTMRTATGNFSNLNLLGLGGFCSVYKGLLPNGQEIAVKRLTSRHAVEGLKNEVVLLAKLQHRNLVRLLGFCREGEEKLLVYEYVPNRSLDRFLFDPAQSHLLNWETRYKIIGGVARGLQYLHEDSQAKIIHRDVTAGNVLLDADMNSKISGFGLARLFPGDQTQASTTTIAGTLGYMSPEYAMRGHYSSKSDAFSFGVLVLEIVTGRRIYVMRDYGTSTDILTHVWEHWRGGTVLEVVAPSLSGRYLSSEVLKCVQIGLLCAQQAPADRPTMASVVLMLSSESVSLPVPQQPAFVAGSGTADEESTAMSVIYSTNEVSITELYPR